MPKDKLTLSPGEIRMRIDHPIETQNYSLKDRKILMERVNKTISKNFKLISKTLGEARS